MAARKKKKEENEPLDDFEHNEDGRGCCYQPLLTRKTDPEAADRSPSRIANVLRDLMRGGQQELRTGIASHFSPGLAALPHFQTMKFLCLSEITSHRDADRYFRYVVASATSSLSDACCGGARLRPMRQAGTPLALTTGGRPRPPCHSRSESAGGGRRVLLDSFKPELSRQPQFQFQ